MTLFYDDLYNQARMNELTDHTERYKKILSMIS